MKIGVIGAGGVGGYFGARLHAAGEEVTFVQRGEHGAAMRARGLRVISPLGDLALPDPVVLAPGEAGAAGPVDLVLVTVKSIHTESAADAAAAMTGPHTAVLSLQNGVENEDLLAARLGAGRVLGGLCYILSLIESPGVVRHAMKTARIEFGERGGGASPRVEAFRSACENAGVEAVVMEDIEAAIWTKFTALCAHNGMTALARAPIGPIREDPDGRAVLEACARETMALAAARGVALDPALVADPMVLFDRVPRDMTSSTLHDLEHGKPLEIDWLNGAAARLSREAGLAAPVNRCIYAALKPWATGTPPPRRRRAGP